MLCVQVQFRIMLGLEKMNYLHCKSSILTRQTYHKSYMQHKMTRKSSLNFSPAGDWKCWYSHAMVRSLAREGLPWSRSGWMVMV